MNPFQWCLDKLFNKKIAVSGTKIKAPRKMIYWGKFDRYPVLCVIVQKRGNSYLIDFDWAGFFKTEESTFYRLKRRKENFMPPELSQIKLSSDGTPILVLWSPARGQYIARDIIGNENIEKSFEDNIKYRQWMINEYKRVLAKSQGFIAKYLPILLMVIVCIVALIGIYIIFDSLGGQIDRYIPTANALTTALNNFVNNSTARAPPAVW